MVKNKYRITKQACYLGYIVQAVVNNLASLFFVIFSAKPFALTEEQLGRIVLINFASQLIIDALSIYIVPRLGYRKCVVLGQASAAIGFVLLGILPNVMQPFAGVIIAILFLAIGSGFVEVIISPIVEALPDDNKAGNMSLLHSFYCWGQAATVVVTTLLLYFLGSVNWYFIPLIWAVLPLFNTFLFARVPILELKGDQNKSFGVGDLAKRKSFYLFLLLMFCAGACELAMVQWSSYFIDIGLNVEKWLGDILGPCCFAVVMGLGRVGYAIFSKKLNPLRSLMAMSLLCAVSYLVVALSSSPILTIAGCAICGLSVSIMWPSVLSIAAKRFPQSGTALFSLLAMFGDLGCALGPWLLGFVSDITSINGTAEVFANAFSINTQHPGLQLGFFITAIIPLIMFMALLLVFVKNGKKSRRNGVN